MVCPSAAKQFQTPTTQQHEKAARGSHFIIVSSSWSQVYQTFGQVNQLQCSEKVLFSRCYHHPRYPALHRSLQSNGLTKGSEPYNGLTPLSWIQAPFTFPHGIFQELKVRLKDFCSCLLPYTLQLRAREQSEGGQNCQLVYKPKQRHSSTSTILDQTGCFALCVPGGLLVHHGLGACHAVHSYLYRRSTTIFKVFLTILLLATFVLV